MWSDGMDVWGKQKGEASLLSVCIVVLEYVGGVAGINGHEWTWTMCGHAVLVEADTGGIAAAVSEWEGGEEIIGVEGDFTGWSCDVEVEYVIIDANSNGDGWRSGFVT